MSLAMVEQSLHVRERIQRKAGSEEECITFSTQRASLPAGLELSTLIIDYRKLQFLQGSTRCRTTVEANPLAGRIQVVPIVDEVYMCQGIFEHF